MSKVKEETFQDESPNMIISARNSPAVIVSKFMARNPYKCFFATLTLTLLMSVFVVRSGIEVSIDSKGWTSRNTLISKREMQNLIVTRYRNDLFEDTDGSLWEEIENNIVQGYEEIDVGVSEDPGSDTNRFRHLSSSFDQCDASKYYTTLLAKKNLFAVYKTGDPLSTETTKSILEKEVLSEICKAETKTHEAMQDNKVCGGGCADENKCLPPHSLLLVLRLELDAMDTTCDELMDLYTPDVQNDFTTTLMECAQEIDENYDSATQSYGITTKCPQMFQVNLIDKDFGMNGNSFLGYTSSYFITYEADDQELYDVLGEYGRTDENIVTVAYDTMWETLTELYSSTLIIPDMSLAMGSLFITFTAMALHTKSLWLTVVGVMQIIFSVPLGAFVYAYFAGIKFFPFLNLLGIFVAAALGADYVFVAVDKWKNARIDNQSATTEDIAAMALPNAASAMFLTTSTTVVAFFSTTICPVASILCFALFCGLLVLFNYVMNVLLLFPALCLYDIWLMNGSRNVFTHFRCCAKSIIDEVPSSEEGEKKEKQSLIHRILRFYYFYLHKFRYAVLAASIAATVLCIVLALRIRLPDSADVRILPETSEFEMHNIWKKELLSFVLFYSGGSYGQVTWGIVPADTGRLTDPDSLSKLVLDESFDPSTTESQTYMLGFCDRLFSTDIAQPLNPEYVCPFNDFDVWLKDQSTSTNQTTAYVDNCNNADSIPMAEDDFDGCMIAYSELFGNKNILEKNGKVKIIQLPILNGVNWAAPYSVMDEFWNRFENYLDDERSNAPTTSNKFFHSATAYWWYDTNSSMLQTAVGACIIAIIFSTIIVLIASRSITLTIFSATCIAYVLAATTSSLVGLGWSLGFLEAVCFAILVGISCDFVIHFGHAYNYLPGNTSKYERTQYAVTHMGPSILAAAFTTFAAAITMLFCQITFFNKFALILLMTILHATIASFVIYIVLTDCFGPSEPTKCFDGIFMKIKGLCSKDDESEKTGSS